MSSTPEDPWPVHVVAEKIGAWIDRLGEVWVEGQLAQVSARKGSKMTFCTLRDVARDVSLTVTAWRSITDKLDTPLAEGDRVIINGKFSFYQTRGTLSLQAREFRAVGIGELLARLEKLKKQLSAEGLFSPEHKKKLPFLPTTIGLICGRSSAAERDVLENARLRWPAVQFSVRNVAVQGVSAVSEVTDALRDLDADPSVDVIVIARGGGSVEDLLPFSDESLVRAVFNASTPVVSAIGHEPDTPLLDSVADLRASTPTDAAKKIVPSLEEETAGLTHALDRIRANLRARIDTEQQRLENIRSRPALAAPHRMIDEHTQQVEQLRERARRSFTAQLAGAQESLEHTRARIRALSPHATLERGYAVVRREDAVIRTPEDVSRGDEVRVTVAEGEFTAQVQ